ncbi:MAG: DNA polymerase IV [Desulfuromonadaceae bacterium]|nr:DNA polymerase IV [Desulfuromonadaceae bacterium]MDD5106694.1 DNA polymerase IV [Desulfuromonadaceae bacterium]
MADRTVMHIDMNSFFASVEQAANPHLKGKPLVVTGSRQRTVILTASYEARAFGIKTGMLLHEAKRLCPGVILVPADNRKYTYTSTRIMEIMLDYTPLVEVFSIDEAWLDVTGSLALFGSAENIAYTIKSRIKHRFDITCSIGIAPNKLLAKLASEMKKPDGLTIIIPAEVSRILERMPIGELCGIGRKTARHLLLMGIRTCGELGRCDEERLVRKFGIIGTRLKQMGKGVDVSPVIPAEDADEVKSVGHSMTLKRDITGRHDIVRYLLQLSERVGRRARRYGVAGKTVHLTIRYADFTTFGRQATLPMHVNKSGDIYRGVLAILDSLDIEQPIRLLGVRITNLCYQREQLPLFEDERKRAFVVSAMDVVNDRFGDFTVTFGSLLGNNDEKGSHVISPAWQPEGIRNVQVM